MPKRSGSVFPAGDLQAGLILEEDARFELNRLQESIRAGRLCTNAFELVDYVLLRLAVPLSSRAAALRGVRCQLLDVGPPLLLSVVDW